MNANTAPAPSAAVRFEGVTVRFPGVARPAVDDVTLAIEAGEFAVMLGPSGSGKSTLLRTVNRLVIPQSGTVTVDGADVRDLPPTELRRGIGYVIQAVGLFPHMTVAKNVAVVPELLGWEPRDIAARVDELLGLVSLDPALYRNRLPRELSGGEAQRVGVARALAGRPRVLLMDEPFGAVDPVVRTSLQDETMRIHRSLGTTILFVTHDVEEALRLADRIVIMHDGRLAQAGTPLATLRHPADGFVQEFLGAQDAVRMLRLLPARTAMQGASLQAPSAQVDAGANLHDALGALLTHGGPLAVVEGDRRIGSLSFDDIRRALAAA